MIVWLGNVLPPSIIAPGTAIFFGLCASGFLPMYALGLYWKGVTRAGAKSGLVLGFLGSVFYLLFIHAEAVGLGLCQFLFGKPTLVSGTITVVDPILVIFPLSFLVTVVVSLFTQPMESAHVERCFKR